jgi:translation initiation factor 4B
MQRRKLALLPRSDRQQESAQTPPTSATESKPKSNPFGTARPVDTDSALKKVEEKLAKEKEHQDEVTSAGKGAAAASSQPTSPTAPRPEKGRGQPKQLLRRTSANTASVSQSDANEVVAAKPEVQEEVAAGRADSTWRKVDPPSVSVPTATAAPAEEEAGWETVPSRTKKANGVGVKATK